MKRNLVLALLLAPAAAIVAVFAIALTNILLLSLVGKSGEYSLGYYVQFFADDRYRSTLWRSLAIAAYVSLLCAVLGYPIALLMARGGRRLATTATLLLATQFFSIYVVKMYGWMLILGNNGIINRLLLKAGVISNPLPLMYNELGVAIGLFAAALPLMVFPINAVLQNISQRYEEAALGLGANRLEVLLSVTLPLSAPGIVSGIILTFVFCFTAYLTPALLGGGFFKMIGNVIYDQAIGRFNYGLAGGAAVVTLVVSLAVIIGVNKIGQSLLGPGR
jgi:putative spermidine/putrescine transport system permease protein